MCKNERKRAESSVRVYKRRLLCMHFVCVGSTENRARVQKRVLFRLLAVESFEITINAHTGIEKQNRNLIL